MVGERTSCRTEGRYLRKDGEPIQVKLTISTVQSTEGRARFAIPLVEDVTEQKRAQATFIEAEQRERGSYV
jgi:PAS domain S-box-containing protein